MLKESQTGSPLRLVCVGTGRDGTTSLSQMIQDVYDRLGHGQSVMHEWASMDMYRYFCDFKETGKQEHLEEVRALLRNCPHDCIVGNGYASILPIIAEIFGDRITLLHLRRRDRRGCVASLVRNAELYPVNHLYYAVSPAAAGKRVAAFHYGDATREEWDSWSATKKFEWYYDKTHALIESCKGLFPNNLNIETESLDEEGTRSAVARAAEADHVPAAVHVNRHFDLDGLALERRIWVQRALGKFDIARFADDDVYAVEHFMSELIFQLSARIDEVAGNNAAKMEEIGRTLKIAETVLVKSLARIEELATTLANEGRS
jgi:hypothetical protein